VRAVVLEAWLADLQLDEAARARARSAWLERQADEEASFVGVLADLAERGRALVVDTVSARRHHGEVRVIGQDFFALRTRPGVDVLVRYAFVVAVRPAPREPRATGDRLLAPVATFRDALAGLADLGARVTATGFGGVSLSGELHSVGRDVLRVRSDDRGVSYVRLASLGEVSVVESG
jgi:hypothetical protein